MAEREVIDDPSTLISRVCIIKADRKHFFLKRAFFEEGEIMGHLLGTVVKAQDPAFYVSSLRAAGDRIVCFP